MQPKPKKALGQHFLADPSYCEKIVRLADVTSDDLVIEIGPGTGRLTRSLLSVAGRVIAIELDPEMIDYLKEHLVPEAGPRLALVQADVLRINWEDVLVAPSVKIVGNLPYSISTRLLSNMTRFTHRFHSFTFMVQKEVADRVLAQPGSKDYGFFTLLMQYHFERIDGFRVPPGAFRPPPKVISSVLKLIPYEPPVSVVNYRNFVQLIQTAFRHRRKTIWNNLRSSYGAAALEAALGRCQVEKKHRPEELSLEDYACLSGVL